MVDIALFKDFPEEEVVLQKFRRALRKKDQESLDELIEGAQQFTLQAPLINNTTAIERLLLLMLIAEHRKTQQLEVQIEHLTERVDQLTERIEKLTKPGPPEQDKS